GDAGTVDAMAVGSRLDGDVVAVSRGADAEHVNPPGLARGRYLQSAYAIVARHVACTEHANALQIYIRMCLGRSGERTDHCIVDHVGFRIDAVAGVLFMRAARIVDLVALHQVVVALDLDADVEVVVEAIVLDQVVRAAIEPDPAIEAANVAMAYDDILLVEGMDALGVGSSPRGQAAELEMVAIDGDVVRGDGDCVAAVRTDVGTQVSAHAPHVLGRDDRWYRINEARAFGGGLGGPGRLASRLQESGQCEACD